MFSVRLFLILIKDWIDETNCIPFDFAEGVSELVFYFIVEYCNGGGGVTLIILCSLTL
jgi:NADH:ubiquinone oxidoreductase subunit H